MPLLWAGSLVVALTVGFVAATVVTDPPRAATGSAEVITAEAETGSVAVEQGTGVTVAWLARDIAANASTGTLTSLEISPGGSSVQPGATLYTVDLAPVLALPGEIPAFRDLAVGAVGRDVEQLESFLLAAGHLTGPADDRYTAATGAAVDRWFAAAGAPRGRSVPLGRVVFLPTMPVVLAPAPDVHVGDPVAPGTTIVLGGAPSPEFRIPVLPEAATQIVPGLDVRIDVDGGPWLARIDRVVASDDGSGRLHAILAPRDDADSICADACTSVVAVGGTGAVPGTVVLVPETHGAIVPTAAVVTDASGSTWVRLLDGTRRDVDVLASFEGRSAVEGIDPGERVVVAGG